MSFDDKSGVGRACSACPIGAPIGVDRRTFLSKAMAGAAMLALAACGGADSLSPFTGSASVNISSYPALATVGGVALATLNGSSLALVRDTETSIVAPLSSHVAMKASYQVRFDNLPSLNAAGTAPLRKSDRILSTGIQLSF